MKQIKQANHLSSFAKLNCFFKQHSFIQEQNKQIPLWVKLIIYDSFKNTHLGMKQVTVFVSELLSHSRNLIGWFKKVDLGRVKVSH